jgi:RNA polymerase sigma factor (sigma-70 family)
LRDLARPSDLSQSGQRNAEAIARFRQLRGIPLSDSELVERLREHDPQAFQRLREHYLPSLWRYVVVRVDGDPHVAEDVVSETMLALLKAFEDDAVAVTIVNLGGWLRGVASHKVQDHFRALVRVRHLIDAARQTQSDVDHASDPAMQHEVTERRLEVRRAMDQLPEQYRIGLEWKYLERLSTREISLRWGTTEKAAESILFRARREFRIQLNKNDTAASTSSPTTKEMSERSDSPAQSKSPNPSPAACDVSQP